MASRQCVHILRARFTPDRFLGYSPVDFSVLDPHWGTIDDWRETIDEIHARGMYLMLDFTVGTMADLIGFEGCVSLPASCYLLITFLQSSQREHTL